MRAALWSLAFLAVATTGASSQGPAQRLERACDAGELVSCSLLGLVYQTGAAGVRDLSAAAELYERACARDVTAACQRLGFLEDGDRDPSPGDERVRVGYVADAYDGTPLGGAVVRVLGIPGVGERSYVSDAEGRVVLDPLPPGRHDIDVLRTGYVRTDGAVPVPWEGDFLVLMEAATEEVATSTGRIYGQITTEGSGAGVSDVDVTVLGTVRTRAISDRQGRFLLGDLPPGPVELRLERLGYEPRTIEVTVRRGRTLQVHATLAVEPVDLAPVEVTVSSLYLERTGFYRRFDFVSGDRFTFRDIEEMNAVTVADVVRRVNGVSVVSPEIGFGSEAISNRRRGMTADAGRCRLRPYYNGIRLVDFNLEMVPPADIEAMEVYQGANVPVQYLDDSPRSGPSCGVVLIWTRDPRRPL